MNFIELGPLCWTYTPSLHRGAALKLGKRGQRTPGPKKIKGCKKEHPLKWAPRQEPREIGFEPVWDQSQKQDGTEFWDWGRRGSR